VVGCCAAESATATADDSFARFVPADVRAFAEVRGLARLVERLGLNGGWTAWTQLAAGQTSRPAVTVEWGERVGRILGMTLTEAARDLFGTQVAVAAPSYDSLAEGVLLALAPDDNVIGGLIAKNRAQSQPSIGAVPCYTLKEGLSLAVKDHIIVLGQRAGHAGLFERTVALLGGNSGQTLATSPAYVEQIKRLPQGSQGVLYLELPAPGGTTTTRARLADPILTSEPVWSSFRRLAVGLYDRGPGLDLHIRGLSDQPGAAAGVKDLSLDPVARLPRSTLLVWAQTLKPVELYRRIMADRSPDQAIFRGNLEVIQAVLRPADLEKDLLAKLGPQVMVVWGHSPGHRVEGAEPFDLPLLSLMIESQDSVATAALLQRLGERFLGWMKVEFARAKQNLDLSVEQIVHGQTTIYRIPLGSLYKGNTRCPYLKTLEISWAAVPGWLILSTHPEHIRQMIDARQAPTAQTFADTVAFKSVQQRDGVSSFMLMQPAAAANLLQSWLDYSAKYAPQILEPLWWKRMIVRRSGRRVEMGIIIKQGSEPGRVTVGSPVLPEMPAAGRLMPGDKISAVDGVTLSEDHPEEDLRDLVGLRRDAAVVLRVERSGKLLDVRIPLGPPSPLPIGADWDPIRSIRYLIGLGRGLEVAGYVGATAKAPNYDATLVLRVNHIQPTTTPR
jgi:hypothetical protein